MMNSSEQQDLKLRNSSAPSPYPQFSKRTIWTIRAVLIALFVLWVAGGIYLNNQVKQDEQRIEQARLEAQRKDTRARRAAQYQQEVQQRTKAPQTRNVFDGR